MTPATLYAFAGGVVGVLAAWEVLGVAGEARTRTAAARWLAPLRRAAGGARTPSDAERTRLVALASGVLLAGGWLLLGPLPAVLLAAAGPSATTKLVVRRRRRWRAAVAAGAPAAARALADAVDGGHGVRSAVGVAAHDGAVPGPAGAELRATAAALDVGEPTDDALTALRDRVAVPAWDALVAAVLLAHRSGGDLPGLLRGLAATQEDARRVEADARSLTAQARFTAQVVAALPILAAVIAEVAAPGWLGRLAGSPLTLALLVAAALLQGIALIAVSRLAKVT